MATIAPASVASWQAGEGGGKRVRGVRKREGAEERWAVREKGGRTQNDMKEKKESGYNYRDC